MGTGSAFQFKKITSKCRNEEGQQRNFAKHVQGPPSPHLPTHPSHSIRQHCSALPGKHKKNRKIIENTSKWSRNAKNLFRNAPKTLQILPKATKQAQNPTNVSKATPKAAKVHQKSPKGGPKAPQMVQKDTKKLPKSTLKGTPKRGLNRTPNWTPSFSPNVSKTQRLPCF